MGNVAKAVVVLLLIVVIVVGMMIYRIDWDVRAIQGRFHDLLELVEKDGEESTFEALGKGRKIAEFFTQDCSIEYLPERKPFNGGSNLGGALVNARGMIEEVSFGSVLHDVVIDPGEFLAESIVSMQIKLVLAGGETTSRDRIKYQILWEKVDGVWLIASVSAFAR